MTHCKRFLECKVRLDRNPEDSYYKGQGHSYPSDCAYCSSYEEDVKSIVPELEGDNPYEEYVSYRKYMQLKTQMIDLRKQLQLLMKSKDTKIQFSKKKDISI